MGLNAGKDKCYETYKNRFSISNSARVFYCYWWINTCSPVKEGQFKLFTRIWRYIEFKSGLSGV